MGGSHKRGFTIVELTVAIGIIIVLAGLGVYAWARLTARASLPMVADEVRALLIRTQNAARENRIGAAVEVPAGGRELIAHGRVPIGMWHFENDSESMRFAQPQDLLPVAIIGAFGLAAELHGRPQIVPGKIGTGLAFRGDESAEEVAEKGGQLDHLEVKDAASHEAEARGIGVDAWVCPGNLLERRRRSNSAVRPSQQGEQGEDLFYIVAKGRTSDDMTYYLRLSHKYAVQAGIFVRPTGRDKAHLLEVTTLPGLVHEGRWAHCAMVYDGRHIGIYVNGVERELFRTSRKDLDVATDEDVGASASEAEETGAATAAAATDGAEDDAEETAEAPPTLAIAQSGAIEGHGQSLFMSHPDLPFHGIIDEVRIGAVVIPERFALPEKVRLLEAPLTIHFNAEGRLEPLSHPAPVRLTVTDEPDLSRLTIKSLRETTVAEGEEQPLDGALPEALDAHTVVLRVQLSGNIR